MTMAMASSPSPTIINRRSRRETVEEELWMLRSRNFVKPESHRLNNSPRFSRIKGDNISGKPTRRWRRKITRVDDEENHHNLVNRVRASAARSARVLQLRIAGKRSWWPSKHRPTTSTTARIAAVEGYPLQHRVDGVELKLKFDKIRKKHSEDAIEEQDDAQESNRVESYISCENQNSNCHELSGVPTEAGLCSDVDNNNTKRVMSNTGNDDSDERTVTDHDDNGDTKEEENRKKRRNIVVAAVATTSVSSLGVALAVIFL